MALTEEQKRRYNVGIAPTCEQVHRPGRFFEYATLDTGKGAITVYVCTSYRHTVTPEYETAFCHPDGKHYRYHGHPKTHGVTKQSGWKIRQ